ncbi:MAG TPA: hypothetical protein VJW76_15655 [Verrucomicrobiae bacterium]|nr:hypothetical protein [Verrucomicrobiae bacterium]
MTRVDAAQAFARRRLLQQRERHRLAQAGNLVLKQGERAIVPSFSTSPSRTLSIRSSSVVESTTHLSVC